MESDTELHLNPDTKRFANVRVVGKGFVGDVICADDLLLGRTVAVKTLPRRLYEEHGLEFPPLEACIKIQHKNIVAFLDVVVEGERILLIQEYLGGSDMFECSQESGVFSEFLARCLFKDLVHGVRHLHESGIAHRDLKQENCVLDKEGTLKIIDFGLACKVTADLLLTDHCGSEEYAAPEVVRGLPYRGCAVDIWAMGVILYDWVVGDLPFGESCRAFTFPNEAVQHADLSPELCSLLKDVLCEN
jgi:serine/threonine protein kinase